MLLQALKSKHSQQVGNSVNAGALVTGFIGECTADIVLLRLNPVDIYRIKVVVRLYEEYTVIINSNKLCKCFPKG